MSAHTPGPWAAVDPPHSIVVRTEPPTKSKFGADRNAAIGGFYQSDPEKLAEAMANARLIAAAPELLEALKLCLPYARAAMEAVGGMEEYYATHAADIAITKATGDVA
jgi:hypothetical protein